jgi:hypothetical protein
MRVSPRTSARQMLDIVQQHYSIDSSRFELRNDDRSLIMRAHVHIDAFAAHSRMQCRDREDDAGDFV